MKMFRPKSVFSVIIACLAVLFLAYVVARNVVAYRDPLALDAAKAKCQQQGKVVADLELVRSHVSDGNAEVVFSEKGRGTVSVTLTRPTPLSDWQAVDYKEDRPAGEQ